MSDPYPTFAFGSRELADHNAQIRGTDGLYLHSGMPFWVRHDSLSPGRLPTFRVLQAPVLGRQHARVIREEILVGDRWVDAKAPAA